MPLTSKGVVTVFPSKIIVQSIVKVGHLSSVAGSPIRDDKIVQATYKMLADQILSFKSSSCGICIFFSILVLQRTLNGGSVQKLISLSDKASWAYLRMPQQKHSIAKQKCKNRAVEITTKFTQPSFLDGCSSCRQIWM